MKKLITSLIILSCTYSYAQVNLDSLLSACYSFSGNALDSSGNRHHGQINGATLTNDRFNNANSAYVFDGSNDYIDVLNWDSLCPSNEVSVSFWARTDAFKSHFAFSLSPESPTIGRLGIQINYKHSGAVPATFWDYEDITSGRLQLLNDPYVDVWEHYVFVVSQSNNIMRIYRDGSQIASKSFGVNLVNKNRTLRIGALNSTTLTSTFNFNGVIDDIRIYNREIDTAEVTAIYTTNPPCVTDTTPNTVKVDEIVSTGKSSKVFPNPSNSGFVYVQHLKNISNKIELYNMDGRLVLVKSNNEQFTTLDVSSLSPGRYVLILSFEDHTEESNLIIE